jgi:ribokinase
MRSHIVVIGSLNADFVVTVPRFPGPGETVPGGSFTVFAGGKGANQAYAAARLGGDVSMVGQVGNDTHAGLLKNNLASAGVHVSHVATDEAVSSGVAVISIDRAGQNQIVFVAGANGTFTADRLEQSRELIAGARIVLLQLEIPIATVSAAARLARASGAVVILDPAPALELPDDLLGDVDYITPNESELATLTGARPGGRPGGHMDRFEAVRGARELLRRGARRVIVKMGALGALLIGDEREHVWVPLPVDAVDTTAAGDAFNAAFAVALARGTGEAEAGTFATAAAACSVTRRGAQASMPTFEEVEHLLATALAGAGEADEE